MKTEPPQFTNHFEIPEPGCASGIYWRTNSNPLLYIVMYGFF